VPVIEKPGVNIVRLALEAPLQQIAQNAGIAGAVVLKKVKGMEGANGFDVVAEKYCDLIEAGVIDPTKVTKSSLKNAASVATVLLMSDCLVATAPEEDDDEDDDE